MIGQGSPSPSRWRIAFNSGAVLATLGRVALVVQFACAAAALSAAEPTMRIRIAWGGGTERTWQGTVRLTAGTLSDPRPLGIEADEPGSMWLEDGGLEIRGRSPRAYDGIDLSVVAPPDAKLIVEMSPRQANARLERMEIPLPDLLHDLHNSPLDDQGNRLLVRRGPGDSLRVRWGSDSLVFTAGETMSLEVEPQLLQLLPGTSIHVKTQLLAARGGRSVSSQDHELKLAAKDAPPAVLNVQVPLPREEGVYDLLIEATERQILRRSKVLADRRVQLVVVAAQVPVDPTAANVPWKVMQELDPASPSWWDRMSQLPAMGMLRKGPLTSGHTQIGQHPLGPSVQLGAVARGVDATWEAYPLSITKPGLPHMLEVEYPSDVAQTMGISIVEPNAAGAVMPIGLDSGFDVSAEATLGTPRWLKHRLLFWPGTKTPVVLITNRRTSSRVVYGKIRVLAGPTHLPRPSMRSGKVALPTATRLMAGYLNRPLFPENFAATEALDSWSGRSLDDWQTFYDGATRLIEYLSNVGHNGLLLTVMADGSTIYPSQVVEPTPRYDTGTFFDQGPDPVRKDVAELLFRMFDREELKLIPALQFSAPLPELEAILRRGGRECVGLEWIGADGASWLERNESVRGLAPYYNPLNERVQQAMLNVVREVLTRYADHPSFGGLALELSADGYAQLPGEDWGFDDETIARFERESGIRVSGSGDTRFQERAQFLLGRQRAAWLDWRATTLAAFHRRVQREVGAARPGTKLYLVGTNPLDTPSTQRDLRPALPSRVKVEDALRTVGVRADLYRDMTDVVLVRPQRIAPSEALPTQAMDLEINRAAEIDRQFGGLPYPAGVFFHEPQKTRLASFDAKSPWSKAKTYTWLVSQISPSDQRNRQRFVHALATLDARALFDGGWLLPMGQETAIVDLVAAFRRLPDARFATLDEETQPVTIRTYTADDQTWIYFANDAPWEASVRLQLDMPAGCRVDELSGYRRMSSPSGGVWTIELGPHDFLAARLASGQVRFSRPQVRLSGNVETALSQRIYDLSARAAALAAPAPLTMLSNSSFDQPPSKQVGSGAASTTPAGGQIPGWSVSGMGEARLDATNAHAGGQAVKFSARGSASLRSDPLETPRTGRLSVSVWLRIEKPDQQPTLRLALEGLMDGKEYYRCAPVGAGQEVVRLREQWAQYVFQVDDLPAEGISQLKVRFDLQGPGELWIDEVQLFDLAFSEVERVELTKIIALANIALQTGKVGDCARVLDGYWPRFLVAHVPLTQTPVAQKPQRVDPPAVKAPEKPAEKPGAWDRVRKIWPF